MRQRHRRDIVLACLLLAASAFTVGAWSTAGAPVVRVACGALTGRPVIDGQGRATWSTSAVGPITLPAGLIGSANEAATLDIHAAGQAYVCLRGTCARAPAQPLVTWARDTYATPIDALPLGFMALLALVSWGGVIALACSRWHRMARHMPVVLAAPKHP